MLYVAIWVICGFVAVAIAQGKGQTGPGPFLAGFLLGPIGIIIVALTPANPARQAQQGIATGAAKKCPQCAELVQPDALICRFCQYVFPPPATLADNEARKVPAANGGARCSACNGGVRPAAESCKHCGKVFVA